MEAIQGKQLFTPHFLFVPRNGNDFQAIGKHKFSEKAIGICRIVEGRIGGHHPSGTAVHHHWCGCKHGKTHHRITLLNNRAWVWVFSLQYGLSQLSRCLG